MSDLKVIDVSPTTTVGGERVELYQWYWVTTKNFDGEEETWLGCVTHFGSNYALLTSVEGSSTRVHSDHFFDKCQLEPNASEYISGQVTHYQEKVRSLMKEAEELTARLGVGAVAGSLTSEEESQALARIEGDQDLGAFKTALVKAKSKELPAIFEAIKEASEELSVWMQAEMVPLKAQEKNLQGSLKGIEKRIFTVDLYAGLSETVVQVLDGEPASMAEKIHLMQRRHYMDEECLANYQTGGMEFEDLDAFDRWLASPDNLERLLPFPRCVVAFRVRRNPKDRAITSLIDIFSIMHEVEADKTTFLYIRNGEKLFRMNTKMEFREHLFPDYEHHVLTSGRQLYAKMFSGWVKDIITEDEYQTSPDKFYSYEKFEPDNLYYDDIQAFLEEEIQHYNLIGILIQGLLDRSPVFHPHPPWKVWSEGGFQQALELVYDSSRALVAGEQPDFEAYRQKLNASLKAGSVTVGQYDAWHDSLPTDRYHMKCPPYGDPGPPELAKVTRHSSKSKECHYAWLRDGRSYGTYGEKYRTRFSCPDGKVLNVDAYTPGDFKIFFADPRTRAQYLKWAPLLLEAEEYHAGNREVGDPPPPTERKRRLRW